MGALASLIGGFVELWAGRSEAVRIGGAIRRRVAPRPGEHVSAPVTRRLVEGAAFLAMIVAGFIVAVRASSLGVPKWIGLWMLYGGVFGVMITAARLGWSLSDED
ncbi:MAG TPA: hypothetical protein VEX86_03145 [Longimicrobium sp.]|nr:hypothetical protein [Longimicrobium sp.]